MTTKRMPPANGWKPGQSGNPAGRKPGTGEVAKLRAAIAEHVPPIIEKLTAAALSGDVGAARLLLERVIPPLKASEEPVLLTLPDGTLTEQGRGVLVAVAGLSFVALPGLEFGRQNWVPTVATPLPALRSL